MRFLFTEVDDCIMAAYRHVTKTGSKISDHAEIRPQDKQLTVGFLAEDGELFMMFMEDHNSSTKRKLAKQIYKLEISIPRFINSQLLPFL
jgi:hypothetical protein